MSVSQPRRLDLMGNMAATARTSKSSGSGDLLRMPASNVLRPLLTNIVAKPTTPWAVSQLAELGYRCTVLITTHDRRSSRRLA